MSGLPTVCVMLSAYNGSRFIEEQIDSILAQECVDVHLIVRDDGSMDETWKRLMTFGKKIRVVRGENLGVGSSFMKLVYDCDVDADYYAFSDQDDVWLKEKLSAAVGPLSGLKTPALYCSNQILADENGECIGPRHDEQIDSSWIQILCENRISGCTMVWNRQMQKLLCDEGRRPSGKLLLKRIHDVWVAASASLVGTILYDEKAYILYRQHSENVVGAEKENRLRLWIKKLQHKSLRNGRSALAEELLTCYRDLISDPAVKRDLETIAFYRKNRIYRKRLMQMKQIAWRSGESYFAFRIKVLLGLV